MAIVQIALTDRCNFKCNYCPVGEHLNKGTDIPYENLIRFLPRLDPQYWSIELTGGEPAVYERIEDLLLYLSEHSYHGLVKTNGSLPIGRYSNFKRIATFHKLKNPPKYFDCISIIGAIEDPDRQAKIDYCQTNNFSYRITGNEPYKAKEVRYMTVFPPGKATPCYNDRNGEIDITDLEAPLPRPTKCFGCPHVIQHRLFKGELDGPSDNTSAG